MALRFTAHKVLKMPPFTVISGRSPVPPSYLLGDTLVADSTELDWSPTYLDWVVPRILALQAKVTSRLARAGQPERPSPDTLFFYQPGDLVLRKSRAIGKLAPKKDGPW